MVRNLFQAFRFLLGIISILIGILGLFIPFLQGWVFILAGVFLIHPESGKKLKEKLKMWWEKRRRKREIFLEDERV